MVSKPMSEPTSGPPPLFDEEWALWEEYQEQVNTLHREWVKQDPTQKSGYVYGISMHDGKPDPYGEFTIKIGMSRSPDKRIKAISKTPVKMPYELHTQFVIWSSDMERAERLLHFMLQQYRLDGEWFKLPLNITLTLGFIWYISPYLTKDELNFRDDFNGGWFTPQDFFTHHLNSLGSMVKEPGE